MTLSYIYHSAFALETQSANFVFDYYKDFDSGKKISELLKSQKDLYVFASHSHPDHFNKQILDWKKESGKLFYIFADDIILPVNKKPVNAIFLAPNQIFSDKNIKVRSFGSTDLGVSFLVEADGKKIFHAGDLNNWHWKDESTREEADEAEEKFLSEIKNIKKFTSDFYLAMFPVDLRLGTDYMRGAIQFAEAFKIDYFSPMHFASFDSANALKPKLKNLKFIEWTKENQTITIA